MILFGIDLVLLGFTYFLYREINREENYNNSSNNENNNEHNNEHNTEEIPPLYNEVTYDTPPLYS